MYFEMSEESRNKLKKLIEQTVFNNVEIILKDEEFIKKLVYESLRGAVRSTITEILQSKDYKNILRDRILKQLNIKENKQ